MKYAFGILFLFLIIFSSELKAQNYDPNFFPIGVWSVKGNHRLVEDYLYIEVDGEFAMPPAAPALHEELFSDLENRGFNAAYMSLDPIGPTLHSILDVADSHGVKVIAGIPHLTYILGNSNASPPSGDDIKTAILNDSIDFLKQHSAVLGYYLYDEPLPGWIDFDKFGEAYDTLLSLSGGNKPILSTWNDVRHMDYIDGYLGANNDDGNGSGLDVVMADTYPFSDTTALGSLADYMPAYFTAYGDTDNPETIGPATPSYSDYIKQIRLEQCNDNGNRPFWIVLQTFGDAEQYDEDEASWAFWRQVQPKEIRLQVWIAIMQGAKGIWYFLYESEYPSLLGMLDVSGQYTGRLVEATAVNAQINQISSILLNLDVVENAQVTVDQGEVQLHDDFTLGTDDKYAIVTNTDYFEDRDIQVSIQQSEIGYEVNSIIDKVSGENIPFTTTTTTIDFIVSLDRADGSLYHISSEVPLAIEYLSLFKANQKEDRVLLSWTTNTEKENDFFQIERSINNYDWESIGKVNGSNNTSQKTSYIAYDSTPLLGRQYYRLKQFDIDGSFTYSNIASVYFNNYDFVISPNPTSGIVNINFSRGVNAKLVVYDTMGEQLIEQKVDGKKAYLNLDNLPDGVYFISFQSEGFVINKKLVLRK